MIDAYPVPFAHACAAVDREGRVLWEQGDVTRVFPLASVTKILTSLATLRAVQAGVFTLTTPAGLNDGQPFTVAHLLSHSSGLAAEGDGTDFRDRPGRRRIYSNQGFDVLGRFVSERIGLPMSRWIDQQVAAPLGLRSTTVPTSPARSGFGNAVDMTLVAEDLLDSQLLDAKTHAALTTVALPGLRGILPGYGMQRNNDWGLGVEIKDGKDPHWTPPGASAATFGHFGMSGSFLWVDPHKGMAATFLGEIPFGQWHKDNWPILGQKILEAAG